MAAASSAELMGSPLLKQQGDPLELVVEEGDRRLGQPLVVSAVREAAVLVGDRAPAEHRNGVRWGLAVRAPSRGSP